MKNKAILLIAAALLYGYLFYQQQFGINLLIFNVVFLSILVGIDFSRSKSPAYWFTLFASLATAIAVTWQGTQLAVWGNCISLLLFSGFTLAPNSSWYISLISGGYSILAAPIVHAVRYLESDSSKPKESGKSSFRLKTLKLGSILLPIVLAVVFLSLYSNANPAFGAAINSIKLDFISWPWVGFTLIGGLLLFGFVYKVAIPELLLWDQSIDNNIIRKRGTHKRNFHVLGLKFEMRAGTILLILLNALLLLFHVIDISHVTSGSIPTTVSQKEYLHQGINTLIASIVIAILIILYYFRGNVNFFRHNGWLKVLTYLWVAQNTLLVVSSFYKNYNYVYEFGLTYKRIGVYVYLTLVLFGLITTVFKIFLTKSHFYLFRKNAWAAYLILIFSTFFNWDSIITSYNLNKAKEIGFKYLIELSDSNLPELLQYEKRSEVKPHHQLLLAEKKALFYEKLTSTDWRSWNYNDGQVVGKLKKQNQ